MWSCEDPGLTNVLEECVASIFRVEKSACGEPVSAGSTQRHIPEDILHSHHCENLKSYTALCIVKYILLVGSVIRYILFLTYWAKNVLEAKT
jgi:hypothetical protein